MSATFGNVEFLVMLDRLKVAGASNVGVRMESDWRSATVTTWMVAMSPRHSFRITQIWHFSCWFPLAGCSFVQGCPVLFDYVMHLWSLAEKKQRTATEIEKMFVLTVYSGCDARMWLKWTNSVVHILYYCFFIILCTEYLISCKQHCLCVEYLNYSVPLTLRSICVKDNSDILLKCFTLPKALRVWRSMPVSLCHCDNGQSDVRYMVIGYLPSWNRHPFITFWECVWTTCPDFLCNSLLLRINLMSCWLLTITPLHTAAVD